MVDLNRGPTTVVHPDESAAMANEVGGVKPLFGKGENLAVGASFEGIWPLGGLTPFMQGPEQIRIAAGGSADDAAGGLNAQEITLVMLDADGVEFKETLATAGAAMSLSTSGSPLRLQDAFVSNGKLGLYAFPVNAADIVIETISGMSIAIIPANRSVMLNAQRAVPAGYEGVLVHASLSTDGNRIDALICCRDDFTNLSAPNPIRTIKNWYGRLTVEAVFSVGTPIPPLSDVFFSAAKSTGSDAAVSASFDMWLRKIGG